MFNTNKRYTAAQLSEPVEQYPDDLSGTLLRIRPHPENNGMHDAAGLLQAIYDPPSQFGAGTDDTCAFEVWFDEGKITFYLLAPTEGVADKYARRVGNAYTNTAVSKVTDPDQHTFPSVGPEEYVAGGELEPERPGTPGTYRPIQHFRDEQGFDTDPYGDITSALLSTDESKVVMQVAFKPASRDWTEGGLLEQSVDDAAETLRADDVVWDPIPRDREPSKKDRKTAKIVEGERRSQAFHTSIRVAAISPDKDEAEARAKDVCGMFSPFYNTVTEQGLEQRAIRGWPSGRRANSLREHLTHMHRRDYTDSGMILTVDELAGVAHIPNGDEKHGISTPKIDWRQAQRGEHVGADSGRFDSDSSETTDAVGDD